MQPVRGSSSLPHFRLLSLYNNIQDCLKEDLYRIWDCRIEDNRGIPPTKEEFLQTQRHFWIRDGEALGSRPVVG